MKPPATSSSSRRAVYRRPSPAQSSTSLSDDDDVDDINKSTFFASADPVAASPAQWSRVHSLSNGATAAHNPRPQTSYASRLPPEILIHILKHLHSTLDLYRCMLVSRGWCECSVELLWHRPNFTKLSTLVKMMRILSRNDQTFLYARFIRRLNFSSLGEEITDFLFTRIAQCIRLERLTLLNCSSITDAALTRVLPCCPNLVALDLTGVNDTTDRAIVALASSTKRLQGINLGGCKKLTDHGILALAANCPLLRRVKLCGLEQITDQAVSALAKQCPLLLEVDLTHCKLVTDESIRNLWTFCGNMREMRLSHCSELTDAAFPAPPPKTEAFNAGPNPFPTSAPFLADRLPPLQLSKRLDHLRLLDLTACASITDEAIEGIISIAPKIRNLVLAKCTLITDRAVECLCALGKHLHYLHLGHANNITDRSIRTLARSCTRLRYIDLANCTQLTDMSVFELSALPKLRRIGLVRVANLTDQAIYALGDRYPTLERIHLSYCDQITVLAIHFLLQKLPKLTHLSLTGIPAFRRSELQQFCRDPPAEFNSTQRSTFCVYSGDGVKALRSFLSELYNSITDDNSQQSGTEYEYDTEDTYRARYTEGAEDDEDEQDDDEDEVYPQLAPHTVPNGNYRIIRSGLQQSIPIDVEQTPQPVNRELLMTRERVHRPVSRGSGGPSPPQTPISLPAHNRRVRGFGHQPIIEASTSPTPSEAASNRSGGTTHSTGTAFFRNYVEAATQTRAGVITPDLVFAEIGHGRGAGPSTSGQFSPRRIVEQPMVVPASYSAAFVGTSSHPTVNGTPITEDDGHQLNGHTVLADSSNSYQHAAPSRTDSTSSWTQVNHDEAHRSISASPTTRELQESVHSAFAQRQLHGDAERGRSVKRSLRNTFTAAEHIASSFLFGRGANGSMNEDASSSARRDGEQQQQQHGH